MPTNQAGKTYEEVYGKSPAINSQTLTQEPDFQLAPTKQENPYDVSAIDTTISQQFKPTQTEKNQDTYEARFGSLMNTLAGKPQDQLTEEQNRGIPQQNQQLTELMGQIGILKNEAQAIPLRLQEQATGRGVTAGGLAPIQAAELRKNAINALSLSSVAQALQGNISLAQQQADRAIEVKYAPVQAEIDFLRETMALNEKRLSREDSQRSKKLDILLNERQRILDNEKAESKSISDLLITLGKNQAPTDIMTKVKDAKSLDDAISIAAPFMQSPEQKLELEAAKLDLVLKRSQIDKSNYELSLLKKYGGLTPAQYAESLKKEEKDIADQKDEQEKNRQKATALQEKVTMLGILKNSKGINSVVGTNIFSRGKTSTVLASAGAGAAAGSLAGPIGTAVGAILGGGTAFVLGSPDQVTGAAQQTIGLTEQLISKEFLDNLINTKAQGATFGALTIPEQEALTAAATYIGNRRIWSGTKGESDVVGYNMAESDYRREIERIESLTRVAYERATGNAWLPDEQEFWDSLNSASEQFNPQF